MPMKAPKTGKIQGNTMGLDVMGKTCTNHRIAFDRKKVKNSPKSLKDS